MPRGRTETRADAARGRASRFTAALGLVALFGLGLRLVYLMTMPLTSISGDGSYFYYGGRYLADGRGFVDVYTYLYSLETIRLPGAEHPPAWTVTLAVPSWLGLTSRFQQQVFASLIGTATIVVVALAARRLAGSRAGIIAAALTAVYPGFWLYERQLLSETLVILGAAAAVLLALRFRERPSWLRAAWVGAVCGLLALTRTEMILIVPLLLIPLMLFTPGVDWRSRIGWLAASGAIAAIIIAPWVLYNRARFDEPVLISSQGGRTLSASNCDTAYSGALIGYKNLRDEECNRIDEVFGEPVSSIAIGERLAERGTDASWLDEELRRRATRYIRAHKERLPIVVLAREGRTWGVFRPFQQLRLDLIEGQIWLLWIQYAMYLAMVPLAIAGAVAVRRRKLPLSPMLALIGTVAITVAITFGSSRYRAPADVAIVLLAGVGLDAARRHVRRRRSRRAITPTAADRADALLVPSRPVPTSL